MRRRRFRDQARIISDVNITPLVDTCLVLLIMFMIATPILVNQAIPVNLPKSSQGMKVSSQNDPFVTVSYNPDTKTAQYYFMQDKTPVSAKDLNAILGSKLNPEKKQTVYLYSDGKTPMEQVISLVDIITSKGGKVSLITEQPK
ncbi:MAG: ExbD/TolR family protein [Spirochaetota bacterium]